MQLVCRDRNRLALAGRDRRRRDARHREHLRAMTGDDVDRRRRARGHGASSTSTARSSSPLARARWPRAATSPAAPLEPAPRLFVGAVENPAAPPIEYRVERALMKAARRRALPPAPDLLRARAARGVRGRGRRDRAHRARRADPVDHDPALGPRAALHRREGRGRRGARRESSSASRRPPTSSRRASSSPTSSPTTRSRCPASPACTSSRSARTRASPSSAHDSASSRESKGRSRSHAHDLQSRSSTVIIGHDQPFCVIGERINPTGRKTFAEELRGGDLSTVTVDAVAQVEAGADMLDVNAGIPLVDEAELLAGHAAHGRRGAPTCRSASTPRSSRRSRPAWPSTRARRS